MGGAKLRASFASSKDPSTPAAASQLNPAIAGFRQWRALCSHPIRRSGLRSRGLLDSLARAFPATVIVGSSSAGEFAEGDVAEGVVCLGLSGEDVDFQATAGRGLRADVSRPQGKSHRNSKALTSVVERLARPWC